MDRDFYKSTIWKQIEPLTRAHLILVAEGVKPMAHCHVPTSYLQEIESHLGLHFSAGRCSTFSGVNILSRYDASSVVKKNNQSLLNFKSSYEEGIHLGYPDCCVEEYLHPSCAKKFNSFILSQFKSFQFNFLVESVHHILNSGKVNDLFNYLMPAQTPCSINCKKTLSLLRIYKECLNRYDKEAARELYAFNYHSDLAKKFVSLFRQQKIQPEQFAIGYLFKN